ncbi:class F sortase [Streptomyces lydicus]|nr:class F sortase [Streptomyces lydicus]
MSATDQPEAPPKAEASAPAPAAAGRPRWGVLAVVGLVGFGMLRHGLSDEADGPPQPGAAVSSSPATPRRPVRPGAAALLRAVPRDDPSLAVSAPVLPLGLDRDGWIEAPPAEDPDLAGWYEGAPSPGERGTAVLVGHVDNRSGPAVFYGLGALEKGRTIRVTREDGRTAVFEVYGVQVFDKRNFPARKVYADTGRPELRVLTCGGSYSPDTGYAGNVVVFARMTAGPAT